MTPTLLLLLASHVPADITWEPTYAAALSRAADEARVIFVAVHSDDEARSEAFWKKVYKDKRVKSLAGETVNLLACLDIGWNKRCPCASSGDLDRDEARLVEAAIREELIPANATGVVASPQHLWLGPNGDVLLAVPYEMDPDELVWCFGEAARLAGGEVPVLEDARPPRRLLYREAYQPPDDDEFGRGLRPEELEEKLAELRSSGGRGGGGAGAGGGGRGAGRWRERLAAFVNIAFTDEDEAQEHVETELGSGLITWAGVGLQASVLHIWAALIPSSRWKVFEDYADHREKVLRNEAAVAFEQLGVPESLRLVKASLKREKEVDVEKNWLRALGAVARDDKSARAMLLDASRDEVSMLRRNALFALGGIAQTSEVRGRLLEAVAGQDGDDATAAACAMAVSRDRTYVAALTERLAVEGTPEALKASLEAARGVLEGGSLSRLESHVRAACRDQLSRERFFFRAVPTEIPRGGGR